MNREKPSTTQFPISGKTVLINILKSSADALTTREIGERAKKAGLYPGPEWTEGRIRQAVAGILSKMKQVNGCTDSNGIKRWALVDAEGQHESKSQTKSIKKTITKPVEEVQVSFSLPYDQAKLIADSTDALANLMAWDIAEVLEIIRDHFNQALAYSREAA